MKKGKSAKLLTLDHVADTLGISTCTADRLRRRGQIRTVNVGGVAPVFGSKT